MGAGGGYVVSIWILWVGLYFIERLRRLPTVGQIVADSFTYIRLADFGSEVIGVRSEQMGLGGCRKAGSVISCDRPLASDSLTVIQLIYALR